MNLERAMYTLVLTGSDYFKCLLLPLSDCIWHSLGRKLSQLIGLLAITLTYWITHCWWTAYVHLVCHMHSVCDLQSIFYKNFIAFRDNAKELRLMHTSTSSPSCAFDISRNWTVATSRFSQAKANTSFFHEVFFSELLNIYSQSLREYTWGMHIYERWRSIT